MSEEGEKEKDEIVLTIERNNGKTTITDVGGKNANKYGMLKDVVLTGGTEEDDGKFNEAKEELSNVAVGETVVKERESDTDIPIDIEENKIEEQAPEAATEQNDFTIANGIIEKIKGIEQKYEYKIKHFQLTPEDITKIKEAFHEIRTELNPYYTVDKKYNTEKREKFEKVFSVFMEINIYMEQRKKSTGSYHSNDTKKYIDEIIAILESIPDEMFNEQPLPPKGGSRNNKTQKRRRNQKPRKGGKSRRNVHKK